MEIHYKNENFTTEVQVTFTGTIQIVQQKPKLISSSHFQIL